MKKSGIALIFMLLSAAAYGGETAGNINDYRGVVRVYADEDVRGKKVDEKGYELFVSDTVKTKRSAITSIDFTDDSKVVMKGNSILEIVDVKSFDVGGGRVIFNIKKQDRLQGLTVRMKSVVIGVKGTTFMVDFSDDAMQIYLKEGQLNVKSEGEPFTRYRDAEAGSFEEFRGKEEGKFEKYRKDMERQFKEFVREFDMEGGRAISIDSNVLSDIEITDDIEKEFLLLDRSFDEYMDNEEDWEKDDEPS